MHSCFQFGEIYERTQPKSVKMYTQSEFGAGDLRPAVWVVIQSSRSHISHFRSHRLSKGTNLSHARAGSTRGGPQNTPKNRNAPARSLRSDSELRCAASVGSMSTLTSLMWLGSTAGEVPGSHLGPIRPAESCFPGLSLLFSDLLFSCCAEAETYSALQIHTRSSISGPVC